MERKVKITIKSPQDYLEERSELIKQSVDLMRKQSRSNQKYAQKMNKIMRQLMALEEKLTGIRLR